LLYLSREKNNLFMDAPWLYAGGKSFALKENLLNKKSPRRFLCRGLFIVIISP